MIVERFSVKTPCDTFPAGQDPSAPLPLRGCRAPRRFPAEPLPNMYRPPKDGRRLKYRSSPDSNLSRHSFSAAVPHSRSSHSPVQSRYVPFRDTVPHCAPRRVLRWFRSACRRLSAPQKFHLFSVQHRFCERVAHIPQLQGEKRLVFIQKAEKDFVSLPQIQVQDVLFFTQASSPSSHAVGSPVNPSAV